jgi:methylglutamate dehydrogenase subunit D
MLDARSPLGFEARFERDGVTLSEAPGFTLTQVAGDDKSLKKVLGKMPAKVGTVVAHEGRSVMRVGAKQYWLLGDTVSESVGVYVTPLSSGRTRILLEGERARDVLAACALIDFDAAHFKPGQFVMTGIHHTPVLIHCIGESSFHIYALRTFALNVWEWLCDVAEGLPQAHAPLPTPTS